jgi:predicted Zn-dependent protease with MMP-like domain
MTALTDEQCREVVREVRRTMLHEVGHHFGMDEGQIRELGYG